jgi:hypothetical protein
MILTPAPRKRRPKEASSDLPNRTGRATSDIPDRRRPSLEQVVPATDSCLPGPARRPFRWQPQRRTRLSPAERAGVRPRNVRMDQRLRTFTTHRSHTVSCRAIELPDCLRRYGQAPALWKDAARGGRCQVFQEFGASMPSPALPVSRSPTGVAEPASCSLCRFPSVAS